MKGMSVGEGERCGFSCVLLGIEAWGQSGLTDLKFSQGTLS